MQLFEKILRKELKQRGFTRSGNRNFLRRVDDVLLLISFERPSSALYAWFCLLPIFYPWPGYYHFSFGRRFYHIFPDVACPTMDAGEEETEAFCKALLQHVDNDILPVLNSFSRAEQMCPFYEEISDLDKCRNDLRRRYFGSRPDFDLFLAMYGYLYLKKYNNALTAGQALLRYLEGNSTLIQELKAKRQAECERVMDMIRSEKTDEIEAMIANNLKDNLGLLDKRKAKRKTTDGLPESTD